MNVLEVWPPTVWLGAGLVSAIIHFIVLSNLLSIPLGDLRGRGALADLSDATVEQAQLDLACGSGYQTTAQSALKGASD